MWLLEILMFTLGIAVLEYRMWLPCVECDCKMVAWLETARGLGKERGDGEGLAQLDPRVWVRQMSKNECNFRWCNRRRGHFVLFCPAHTQIILTFPLGQGSFKLESFPGLKCSPFCLGRSLLTNPMMVKLCFHICLYIPNLYQNISSSLRAGTLSIIFVPGK